MKITVITLFPQMFVGPFNYSIIKRAQEEKLIEIQIVDLRNFGIGKHKIVDDKPYGGGIGMILKVDVLKKAIDSVKDLSLKDNEEKVILMSAAGKSYKQMNAKEYSRLKHLIIICGHYEGADERIKKYINEEISIGDFVLTGGEIPAMIIIDSVGRLIRGVLKEGATVNESFSEPSLVEHPQYTRPFEFEGSKVPQTLTSGNHKEIEDWKKNSSLKKTLINRKDLTKKENY